MCAVIDFFVVEGALSSRNFAPEGKIDKKLFLSNNFLLKEKRCLVFWFFKIGKY